ncbi:MAG: glycosyltransferase [Parcubacteria group bacterium]|jgi:glycosyltransferase involved in cell wall biosynthesis
MKVLTIAATPFFSDRGCHIRIYNEAKYLEKLGAKVRLCTYYLGENPAGLDIQRTGKTFWYKKISPGFSWAKIWLDFKLLFLVRREIKKFHPDVIHAHLFEGLAVGRLASLLAFKRIPIVFDLQGDLMEEFESYNGKNNLAKKLFVAISNRVASWADRAVVSSENAKFWKPGFQNVGDGVDLELFKNPVELGEDEKSKIEKIKDWKKDARLLVYIGGLSDNKGVGGLLESFGRWGENNQWKLLLGGFGKNEKKYRKYIQENNLADKVHLAGRVKYFSLPAYLVLADAAIDPKNESAESSGKLMGYMAAGLPIICFGNEFNKKRLGEEGVYINSMSEIRGALLNLSERSRREYESQEFSEEKEVSKLFSIIQSLTK